MSGSTEAYDTARDREVGVWFRSLVGKRGRKQLDVDKGEARFGVIKDRARLNSAEIRVPYLSLLDLALCASAAIVMLLR